MQSLRSQRGVSLIEIMVAGAVIALIMTALIGSYLTGQESTATAGARERAVLLADEGIEAVRSIRDGGWSNLTDGSYGVVLSGGVWALSGTSDVTGEFTRSVTISTIDATSKEITSEVTWQQNGQRSGVVTLETRLTDWAQATVAPSVFRAREYYLGVGVFSGTTYDLTLANNLEQNYFVLVQGSAGDGTNAGDRGPNDNYVSLTGDPFGTGDLAITSGPNVLSLIRQQASDPWVGVITVVECMQNCNTSGFTLRDVSRVDQPDSGANGATTNAGWSDLGQVMLVSGFNGAGCDTAEPSAANTVTCMSRIWPSGTNTINWERNAGGATLGAATSTVMAVEWGSEWQVQRVTVTGSAGGDGADAVNEYDTATIDPVDRDHTWVWAGGITSAHGIGNASEGTLITLGDGVAQQAIESSVAVGQEYNAGRTVDVYALTHPLLQVDYRFKPDGNDSDLTYDVPVDSVVSSTARIALVTNGQNETDTTYPRPMFSARYYNNTTIRLERRRYGQAWPAWVQGIDFSQIMPSWWDTNYQYRMPLTITTGPNTPANGYDGYTVRLTLNTKNLNIRPDCNDLRIARDTGAGWQEIDRQVIDCNTPKTDIRFKLVDDIGVSSSDTNYYLYYGYGSASAAGALGSTNVYLWYDDATTDRSGQYVFGRCDPWEGSGYTPWAYSPSGYYIVDTGDDSTACFRYPVAERDAYIEAELYHTGCYPTNMSTGLLGRYILGSGSGASEDSNTYYASNRAEQSTCGNGYAHDGDICEGGRCPLGINGKNPKAIVDTQWRVQALALWGINPTNGRFWDDDSAGGLGPIGWPSPKANADGSDSSDIESSGDWGIIASQDTVRVRNILIRRYTDPEPSVSVGSEETQ